MFTVYTQFINVAAARKYNMAGHVLEPMISFTSGVAHRIVAELNSHTSSATTNFNNGKINILIKRKYNKPFL